MLGVAGAFPQYLCNELETYEISLVSEIDRKTLQDWR